MPSSIISHCFSHYLIVAYKMKGGVIHMRDIMALEKFNIDPISSVYNDIKKQFTFNDSNFIDYDWISHQINYINALSDRQKHILRAYTIYGDKFVNNYLRNTLTDTKLQELINDMNRSNEDVFMYQHSGLSGIKPTNTDYIRIVRQFIPLFIDELNHIIINSPPLVKPIKVFRGVKDRTFFNATVQQTSIEYNEFISTSMYLPSATTDVFMGPTCCLFEMTLNPGTPCIFIAHMSRRRNEFEITLGLNTKHTVINVNKKLLLNDMDHYDNTDIFINPSTYDVPLVLTAETTSIL
jgi:hypothetical protein